MYVYKRTTDPIEARQLHPEEIEELRDWCGGIVLNEMLLVPDDPNEVTLYEVARPHDFLVHQDKHFAVYSPDLFAAMFVEA